ncbi:hypothetical protein BaRGS_00026484 [Batillaria attramentaria]|uniref:Sugar phosphate transporter domain-containing protein n=1 Tax=Batillaria attramentaria TaxID=370345 RepID=A0ABD0K4I7_9CAEN
MASPDEVKIGGNVSNITAPCSGERTPPVVREYPTVARVLAALLYAVTSFLTVIVNKIVLTTRGFPSFLALGLMQVWPLPVFYFGIVIFGLGGTKKVSVPMFVVLRRFSNLFVMVGEYIVLGVVASRFVQFTVFLMILGAVIAASNDLSFDVIGYTYIFCANICSSSGGVYTKKKLDLKVLDKDGLIFYNSLLMLLPTFLLACATGDIDKVLEYPRWNSASFVLLFLLASLLGFAVNYTTVLCTQYNSALTTSIVGVLKNVLVTYVGMIIGGDYQFSIVNFLGINISVVGGVMYSYAVFWSKPTPPTSAASLATRRRVVIL